MKLSCKDDRSAGCASTSMWGVRRLRYNSGVGTDAATVLSDGLALPEEERARVAAELFASLESRDPEYSAEQAAVWARTVEERVERFARGESQGVDLGAARSGGEASD